MGIFNEKIFYNRDLDQSDVFYVKSAGVVYPDPSYSITRENSDTVVIAYVSSGQAYLECGGNTYTLYPGDAYIMPARIYSKIYSDKRNPHTMSWVNMRGRLVDELIKVYFGDKLPIIAACNIDKDLAEIRSSVAEKTGESDRYALIVHRTIITVKNALKLTETKRGELSNRLEDRVESFIVNRLQEKFSVAALAEHFDMSVPRLIKLFRDRFGCTPYSYYLTVKVDIAKKMLTETNLTVEDIACRLNFLDRNHFAKAFQKKTGTTPSAYRKAASGH